MKELLVHGVSSLSDLTVSSDTLMRDLVISQVGSVGSLNISSLEIVRDLTVTNVFSVGIINTGSINVLNSLVVQGTFTPFNMSVLITSSLNDLTVSGTSRFSDSTKFGQVHAVEYIGSSACRGRSVIFMDGISVTVSSNIVTSNSSCILLTPIRNSTGTDDTIHWMVDSIVSGVSFMIIGSTTVADDVTISWFILN